MQMYKNLGDFLLSSWLWQMTFDWFHPVFCAIVMFCLLRFVMRKKRIRSLIIAISPQIFAIGSLSFLVLFVQDYLFDWSYSQLPTGEALLMAQVLIPSIGLALLYIIFQTIFFAIGRIFCSYNFLSFFVLTLVSNSCAALFSFMLIRLVEFWRYTG